MNTKTLVVGVAILTATVGYGAYRLGMNRSESHVNSSSVDPASGKRVLYWHDPMVPGQRFDKPGKSPYMNMQLVPVYADNVKDGSVAIDPRVQQRLGVRTALVERKALVVELSAAGSIEYNQRDVAVVQARANGFVERVHVRTPLQAVSAGQVLADVYVPDWVAAQEEYLAVQRMQSEARNNLLTAASQRMRLAGMSDEQIASVAQGKTVQARLSVHAPIAGIVTELTAREGMTVTNGAPLFRINGVDSVWVYAEVPEARLSQVKQGVAATATATALAGATFQGKVLAVLPEVSEATRTAKVRIELRNDNRLLSAGMFVNVRFETPQIDAALIVPSEAVIATGARSIVIVAEEGGRFKPVPVEVGIDSAGVTEIRSGLQEGQRVVASAQFLIDSEASLKATTSRMSELPQ
jgi:Cu(I)/Ag(I) efflux system membrane fusion protein